MLFARVHVKGTQTCSTSTDCPVGCFRSLQNQGNKLNAGRNRAWLPFQIVAVEKVPVMNMYEDAMRHTFCRSFHLLTDYAQIFAKLLIKVLTITYMLLLCFLHQGKLEKFFAAPHSASERRRMENAFFSLYFEVLIASSIKLQ